MFYFQLSLLFEPLEGVFSTVVSNDSLIVSEPVSFKLSLIVLYNDLDSFRVSTPSKRLSIFIFSCFVVVCSVNKRVAYA